MSSNVAGAHRDKPIERPDKSSDFPSFTPEKLTPRWKQNSAIIDSPREKAEPEIWSSLQMNCGRFNYGTHSRGKGHYLECSWTCPKEWYLCNGARYHFVGKNNARKVVEMQVGVTEEWDRWKSSASFRSLSSPTSHETRRFEFMQTSRCHSLRANWTGAEAEGTTETTQVAKLPCSSCRLCRCWMNLLLWREVHSPPPTQRQRECRGGRTCSFSITIYRKSIDGRTRPRR